MSDDQKISQRYRGLPREEPPRALDDAILAASRRAAETRPAPLVVPTGRRWYFPLAAAAIIVLAVAVTIHVERERPDAEVAVQAEPVAKAPAEEKPAKTEQVFVPDPKPAVAPGQPAGPLAASRADSRELRAQRDAISSAEQQAARAPREREGVKAMTERAKTVTSQLQTDPAPVVTPTPEQRAEESARRLSALANFTAHSPEQWLQGIADLKRQGRHDEAEKSLAEFRKRYPGYRIPEAITEKFEKR